jgi:hypothetical protein
MVEPFELSVDSDWFAATFWYAGNLTYKDQDYTFTVMVPEDNYVGGITWVDNTPPEEILEEVESQIRKNF